MRSEKFTMTTPTPTPHNLNPFVKALRQANFTLGGVDVRIENFSLPFLEKQNGAIAVQEPLPFEFLFPWQNASNKNTSEQAAQPKLTLLHFSLHECEPCHTEIAQLQKMLLSQKIPPNVQVWQVVGGTNASAVVAAEMMPLVPNGAKTRIDPEDGLSERLGAIGAPATWLLDEAGLVVGYRNGDLDFEAPGMEVLFARLQEWPSIQERHPQYSSLAHCVANTTFVLPDSSTTSALKKIPVNAFALVVLCVAAAIAGVRIYKKIRSRA
jgi:hypothetical protein